MRIRVNSVDPGTVATKLTGFVGSKPESVTGVFVYLASGCIERSYGANAQFLAMEIGGALELPDGGSGPGVSGDRVPE